MAVLDPSIRMFTCDVTVMKVGNYVGGSQPGTLTYKNILGIFTDCTLRFTKENVNAFLPHDVMDPQIMGFVQNRTKRKQWFVDLGTVLEKTLAPFSMLQYAVTPGAGAENSRDAEIERGQVAVAIMRPGGSTVYGATPANVYTGVGLLTDARLTFNLDGLTMQNGTITGQGDLLVNTTVAI
jgi:hypothetical protein